LPFFFLAAYLAAEMTATKKESSTIAPTAPGKPGILWALLCLVVAFLLAGTRAEAFFAPPAPAPGQNAPLHSEVTGQNYDGSQYDALDSLIAAKTGAPAKRASGSTVLGHYPEYMNMADSLGHRRFDIPKAAWDKMTDAQRWTANQKFLDRTISRGDDILLSTPLDKVKPGSYFERELQYLSGKGYTPSADGTRLIPGGN
jgi:hypothetical protein